MNTPAWAPQRLHKVDDAQIEGLADILIDCVEGGASVSFMSPLTRERATAFWRKVARGVAAGERALLIAEDTQGLCGTVQLILEQPENQPHRADLAKMLVHRRARRRGRRARLRQDAAGARHRERRRRAPVRAGGLGAGRRGAGVRPAAPGWALRDHVFLPQPLRSGR